MNFISMQVYNLNPIETSNPLSNLYNKDRLNLC